MVNAGVFVLGVLIFGFALVAPSFGIGLGTSVPLNAVSNSSLIVSVSNPVLPACTLEPGTSPPLYSCVYSLTVTNNRESQTPLTVWWGGCTSSTCPISTTQTANVPEGQSATVSLQSYAACNVSIGIPGCFINVPPGSYTLAVFTSNSAGTPDSNTLTANMCVPGPCTTTTTSTTSTISTSSNTFSFYYPYYVTLSSINPPGTSVSQCTSSCSNGESAYTANWTPGTTLSVSFTFSSSYTACWEYSSGGACTPITSGAAFTLSTEAAPQYVQILTQTSTTQPVTIEACVGAPNPCDSSNVEGSWSPALATLSGSHTAATFTFTPGSGYECSGSWYLVSVQAGQVEIDSGIGALSGVTFTWAQVQGWESSYGTSLELVSGTPSGLGCTSQTSTYTVAGVGSTTSLSGPGCSGDSCTGTIVGPESLTFLAFCGAYTICQTVQWTVNGVVDSSGNQNGLTVSVSPSEAYTIVAYGTGQSSTTTSTGTTPTTSTTSTETSSTTSGTGSVLPSSITLQQGIEALGAIVAVAGLAMPGPRTAVKK